MSRAGDAGGTAAAVPAGRMFEVDKQIQTRVPEPGEFAVPAPLTHYQCRFF